MTGKLVTMSYRVEGPVTLIMTTTAIEIDEELMNRCIVLTVDEGREQTRAIHELQRTAQTLDGLLARQDRERIRRVHRNAQRLIRPMLVVNPFAPELKFADHVTRTRRDHMKYLTIIRAVTLLFQYQRPVKRTVHAGKTVEYIETTKGDIEVATKSGGGRPRSIPRRAAPANETAARARSKAMVDEQAKAKNVSRSNVRFTRRQLREHTSWGPTQVQVHLRRLEELEYVCVHRRSRPDLRVRTRRRHRRRALSQPPRTTPTCRGKQGTCRGAIGGVSGPFSGGYRGGRNIFPQPETSSILDPHVNGVGNARTGSEREKAVVRP